MKYLLSLFITLALVGLVVLCVLYPVHTIVCVLFIALWAITYCIIYDTTI